MIHYQTMLFRAGHKDNDYKTACGSIEPSRFVDSRWDKVTCPECLDNNPTLTLRESPEVNINEPLDDFHFKAIYPIQYRIFVYTFNPISITLASSLTFDTLDKAHIVAAKIAHDYKGSLLIILPAVKS